MSWIHAIILGAVEGLTEFLPVSSTGHLILASELFRVPKTEFLKSFEIAVQLGAILAVLARSGDRGVNRDRLATLSPRERDVALAVGRGETNAEIAAALHLSVATVKAHVSRLLDKLDVDNRVQIALLVQAAGEH